MRSPQLGEEPDWAATGSTSPSPWGEGRGEGELLSLTMRSQKNRRAEPAPAPLGLQLRRFRPPVVAKLDFRDERPSVFRSSSFGGTITDTRGPFITSGEW